MPLVWLKVDGALQNIVEGRADNYDDFLKQTGEIIADSKLIILLPGECVAMRVLPTPPKSRTQFTAAAHYLLEDALAENIENLHIATATRTYTLNPETAKTNTEENKQPLSTGQHKTQSLNQGVCLAVPKRIMDKWYECFTDHNLYPDVMTADFLAMPLGEDDTLSISVLADKVMVNGYKGGFSTDYALSETILPTIIDDWAPSSIDLYGEKNAALDTDIENINYRPIDNYQGLIKLFETGSINKADATIPHLLSGDYVRKIDWRANLMPLRGIAVAASVCALLLSSLWMLDGLRASREANAYEDLSLAIHNQAFPNARGQDPAQFAKQILGTRTTRLDFLDLWLRFGQAVNAQEGIEIDAITYAENNQSLRISIRVEGRPNLDSFIKTLREKGINADEGRMNNTNSGQFTGDLVVRL